MAWGLISLTKTGANPALSIPSDMPPQPANKSTKVPKVRPPSREAGPVYRHRPDSTGLVDGPALKGRICPPELACFMRLTFDELPVGDGVYERSVVSPAPVVALVDPERWYALSYMVSGMVRTKR